MEKCGWMRLIILALLFANTAIPQTRLAQNPILTSASSSTIGTNINGPSLIRAPVWMEKPLGRYYLYFAHHAGKFIRLAYANQLSGPWTVYEPGTLQLNEVKACHDHIASPDVHVVDQEKKIRMYFHCPVGEGGTDIIIYPSSLDSGGNIPYNRQLWRPSLANS